MTQLVHKQPDADPDALLVERVLSGDEAAFSTLYRRYAPSIAALVYRILGRDADLDDIVQETFVEGHKQLGALEDRSKVKPYLTTIAVRRVHARLSWKYRVRGLTSHLFGLAPPVSDPDARDVVHSLYRVLAKVQPKQRVAWVLHRVEGFTLPETAEHCETSLATVKRWVASVDATVEECRAS